MSKRPTPTFDRLRPGPSLSVACCILISAMPIAPAAGEPLAAPGSELQLQAGGAAIVKPKYEGSRDYEVVGAPIVAPAGGAGNGIVQFKGVDDLRFKLLDTGGFEAGPLAGYRFDREEDDADRLRGLGDVDGGLVVGGYLAYRIGAVSPFVSYHHQVTGDDTGGIARVGVEARVPLAGAMQVTANAGATWADDDYMQSFFGVTAAQSLSSGLARFDAEAGFKDVFLGLSTDVPLTDRWSLKLSGRFAHLIGDASDSPIVESESQWQGLVGVTYRFSISR